MQLAQSDSKPVALAQAGAWEGSPESGPDALPQDKARLIPLEVFINGARAGDWVLLDLNGVLHAPIDAFEEWRLMRKPDVPGVPYRGQLYFPLSSVPGFEAHLNALNQSLDLKFLPSAFATTRLVQEAQRGAQVTQPLTSVFLNYDVSYTQSNFSGQLTTRDLGALTELGLSSRLGVLTNTGVGHNLEGDPNLGPRGYVRLETTFNRDFPDSNMSLRLGDSTTRTGSWGRQVYFGGVQLAKNFTLQPSFITQPIPTLAGSATAPSTVDLYINDSLRQTSQVPSGPFTVDNFPLLTGSGQARLVVRDVLGRETVLVQDFFTHSNLLKQGLSDWSLEAGAVRDNLGTESADYGERFGSGLLRYGMTNGLTLESRAEGSGRTRNVGLGFTAALPDQILGQVALSGSKDDFNGTGSAWIVGAEHVSLKHGFTARAEGATADYRRIGQLDVNPSYRRQSLLSYTYSMDKLGYLGLAYARTDTWTTSFPITSYTGNYTLPIGQRNSLTFTATHVTAPTPANAIGVNVVIPLDNRTTVAGSTTTRSNGGGTDGYVSASQTLTAESGPAWRALAGRRAGENYGEGGLYYQGSHGLVTLDASGSDIQSTGRLGAVGGLVVADGKAFASRRIQDSFAVVEVPGYADVGVGYQSTVISKTDSSGAALVPGLLPYRQNSIRLNPNELPISAEIDTIEMVTVPPARSGVLVKFPVRSGRGALVSIVLDDGQPAPAGAQIELEGDTKEFYVARHGEAFVTGLQAKNTLRLKWNGQACSMTVELPGEAKGDEITRVGPVTCAGVTR
ncbi:MAG TPA: fimbria/pilus outer membrane usher protein [Burkholderiales bacterium]|nr:fimbria/pilus outer membrane usher protein [Burkholderiales bacterium]